MKEETVTAHPSPDELRAVAILADLPQDSLEWLASLLTVTTLEPGEVFFREGDPANHMFILLEGDIRAGQDSNAGEGRVYVVRAGQVTGMLPYSRLTHFSLSARAVDKARVALLSKDHFPEVLERLPILQERLVGVMADRIRETTKVDQQRDKLMSLGKLSAGLAHELNNPAAAARRAAASLREAISAVRSASLRLDKNDLPQDARVFLARLDCDWAKETGPQEALDTLDRSDREELFAAWLDRHNVPEPWELAPSLVDAGCRESTLDQVAARVPPALLGDALMRLTAAFTISRLVDEIESSSAKISELVRAIKDYSYMDQMPEQEVNIHDGIESTLIMLRHRLKNGVSVVREYDRALPKVCARGGELNQVWTNLIGNAVDAMNGKGELKIKTAREGEMALVEIIDNGPGIPREIQNQIFDPFFTTKGVGEGTGLGLDTVRRIVLSHRGDVRFESAPGCTSFQVRIPIQRKEEAKT